MRLWPVVRCPSSVVKNKSNRQHEATGLIENGQLTIHNSQFTIGYTKALSSLFCSYS